MFIQGLGILCGSAVDPGNVAVSRPTGAQKEACAEAALAARKRDDAFLAYSERSNMPERYTALQRARREDLESFLYVEAAPDAYRAMIDRIVAICEENSWSAGATLDDPAHPVIDRQAAETGALLSWVLRRYGARLAELNPRLAGTILYEVRRRLLVPVSVHEDYPFLRGEGRFPVLILSDLLLACLFLEESPNRRMPPVKVLLRALDRAVTLPPDGRYPLVERLGDACAAADLARLIKRLTRGEMDLTDSLPRGEILDDILMPWITEAYFVDPAGGSILPALSGMDVFRLGYLSRDRALCALGAKLLHIADYPPLSVSGRLLSVEYRCAAEDECGAPPRVKYAASADGGLLLSRTEDFFSALSAGSEHADAGNITLFTGAAAIICAAGGRSSLPVIGGCAPLKAPRGPVVSDHSFSPERDLMSVDLTDAYPEACALTACQRTLISQRSDNTVRVVDAFEFNQSQNIDFVFFTPQKPLLLRDCLRLGPVELSWDGNMKPTIEEVEPAAPEFSQLYRLCLSLPAAERRVICGFTFELS